MIGKRTFGFLAAMVGTLISLVVGYGIELITESCQIEPTRRIRLGLFFLGILPMVIGVSIGLESLRYNPRSDDIDRR